MKYLFAIFSATLLLFGSTAYAHYFVLDRVTIYAWDSIRYDAGTQSWIGENLNYFTTPPTVTGSASYPTPVYGANVLHDGVLYSKSSIKCRNLGNGEAVIFGLKSQLPVPADVTVGDPITVVLKYSNPYVIEGCTVDSVLGNSISAVPE